MSRYTYSDLHARLMALQEDLEDLDDISCHCSFSKNDMVHFLTIIPLLRANVDELLDRAFEYEDEE